MKKLLALMVVFAALVSTGCKKETPPPANPAPPAETPAEETPAEPPANP